VKNFNSLPGKGAEGEVNGNQVMAVSPGYLSENRITNPAKDRTDALSAEGKTIIFILLNKKLVAAIALADIIREESEKAISELKGMGITTIMITGDNTLTAEYVAKKIGIDEIYAGVLPSQKADKIKEIKSKGMKIAMTGDGVNDAPALAMADVGIAIGGGTDVAAETADIILVKSNPADVTSLIRFARKSYSKMIQNLLWATGYNIIALPLAAGVLYNQGILLTPAAGAVLMSLSTVIVAINAKLLKS
jgi:P-type Cu2+ transporter